MRLYRLLPAIAVLVLLGATLAGGLVAFRLTGPGGGAVETMMERWLRRDATAGVEVYPGILPPALDAMLNSGVTGDPRARVTLPVHPGARLLGSSYVHEPDGDLVWMMYDVPGDLASVAAVIAQQLSADPWIVIGGSGEETSRVIHFANARLGNVQGQAIVELEPRADSFRLTVQRDAGETALTVRRTALSPSIGAITSLDLTVDRVNGGLAAQAGLRVGDRIVRVDDTPVATRQELAAALQSLVNAGPPRAAITYLVAAPVDSVPVEPFLTPKTAIVLPPGFPAPDAWEGLTVIEYGWGPQLGYQAAFATTATSAAVANRVRDGLAAAGWEISGETPQGAATLWQIAKPDEGRSGQVGIGPLPGDSAYLQVVVQIQGG